MFMTEVKMQNAAISVEGDFQCGKFFIRVHFFENTSKIRARYEHLSNKNTSKIRAKIRVKLKFLRQKCVNQQFFYSVQNSTCFFIVSRLQNLAMYLKSEID